MRKLLFAILGACLLTSCMTDAKLSRLAHERGICPTIKDSLSEKDSVVITKHDTVFTAPPVDGPVVDIQSLLAADSLQTLLDSLRKHPITKKKNGLTITVSSSGKDLKIDCKEDSMKIQLRNAITREQIYKKEFEKLVVQEKCTKQHHTEWDTFCNRIVDGILILLGLLVVYLIYRIRKKIIEKVKKYEPN